MKYLGDLEQSVRQFGEDLFGDFWRKCVDDLEKSFGDIGENRSVTTLEIWRNMVSAVMSIS